MPKNIKINKIINEIKIFSFIGLKWLNDKRQTER